MRGAREVVAAVRGVSPQGSACPGEGGAALCALGPQVPHPSCLERAFGGPGAPVLRRPRARRRLPGVAGPPGGAGGPDLLRELPAAERLVALAGEGRGRRGEAHRTPGRARGAEAVPPYAPLLVPGGSEDRFGRRVAPERNRAEAAERRARAGMVLVVPEPHALYRSHGGCGAPPSRPRVGRPEGREGRGRGSEDPQARVRPHPSPLRWSIPTS